MFEPFRGYHANISKKGAKIKKNINVQSRRPLLAMHPYRPLLAMWFRRVECHFVPSWGSFIQFEYFNKFVQTVKITVIVLFNDVVNFAPKFALNYLHFAFFAYLNLVHILLHDKICAKLLFSLIFACGSL